MRMMLLPLSSSDHNLHTSHQEYLLRLQAQKSGSGAQAFDFLSNPDSEAKKNMIGEMDNGFTSAQLQVLDDTSEVRQLQRCVDGVCESDP